MTTTINASPTNGIVQTADGSGLMKLQSNGVTTNALAWVNFNGTGTVAIRSSYNVSSITDNGTGDYTINFATALSDANYAVISQAVVSTASGAFTFYNQGAAPTTSAVRVNSTTSAFAAVDAAYFSVAIFGN
jgi:hypothetical protein